MIDMIKEIEVTEDLLKVLPLLKVSHVEREFTKDVVDEENGGTKQIDFLQTLLTIDSEDLFLSEDIINDMAFALNLAMQNEPDMDGERKYDDWILQRLMALAKYIKEHLYDLITLIFQFASEGLQVGIYRCKDNEMIWKKK